MIFLFYVVIGVVTAKPDFPNTAMRIKVKPREMESNK